MIKKRNVFQAIKNVRKQLLYLVSVGVLSVSVLLPAFATPSFTDFSISSGYQSPRKIVSSGGSLWYLNATNSTNLGDTLSSITTSGTVTDYSLLPSGKTWSRVQNIAVDASGNVWFIGCVGASSSSQSGLLGYVTPSTGSLTTYPTTSVTCSTSIDLSALVIDGKGNLWVTQNGGPTHFSSVLSFSPSGVYRGGSAPCGAGHCRWETMTYGPNNSLWITDSDTYAIRQLTLDPTTDMVIGMTTHPTTFYPWGITTGPDGNLWFNNVTTSTVIEKMAPSGTLTAYTVTSGSVSSITSGPDGAMWFTANTASTGYIGRLTTSGSMTEYTAPTRNSAITTGPDSALWFIEAVSPGKIGRFAIVQDSQTISFTSTAPVGVTIDSPDYIPTASSTSGLPVTITVDSSSSSVCSIDGSGKVSYQGVGICTLNADQAGNIDYKPAAQVQQSFTVLPVNADSSVTLNCPSTVSVNSTVTCTITVTNDGPATANDVNLSVVFPSSLTSPSLSGGGTISGQTITWSALSLASGASTTLTFSATASAAGKARFNAALLQTSPDPSMSNNIAEATIVAS